MANNDGAANGGLIGLSDDFLKRIDDLEKSSKEAAASKTIEQINQEIDLKNQTKEIESLKEIIKRFRESNDSFLYTALSQAQAEMPIVDKDATSFGKQTYATLANIIRITKPILAKYGLSVFQHFDHGEFGEEMVTTLCHKSGQSISSHKRLPEAKYFDKEEVLNGLRSEGKAISYLRRYCVCAILGLATEEVD